MLKLPLPQRILSHPIFSSRHSWGVAVSSLFGVFFATSVLAADPVPEPIIINLPSADEGYDWNSLYIGGHAGYAWGSDKTLSRMSVPNFSFSSLHHYSPDSLLIGGQMGYLYQFDNNLIIGAETSARYMNARDGFAGGFYGAASTRSNMMISTRARVGYAFDRTQIYGLGGAVFGNIRNSYFDPFTLQTMRRQEIRVGYTLGVGIEYALNEHWVTGLQYSFSDFGHYGMSQPMATPLSFSGQRPMFHDVSVEVNYKF